MLEDLVRDIGKLTRRRRFTLSTEKATQGELATAFEEAGIVLLREHRLSARDVLDFFDPATGLVVEVKVTGAGKMDTYRQLARYAAHEPVRGLLLLTNLAMGLPDLIEGKPAFQASLGRGWL